MSTVDRLTRTAATVAVAGLVGASALLAPMAARAAESCLVVQAETGSHGKSKLRWLDVGSGATSRVTEPGYRLNALGYSATRNLVYGVAEGLGRGAHAVTIDRDGKTRDLGPITRAGNRLPLWSPVAGVTMRRDRREFLVPAQERHTVHSGLVAGGPVSADRQDGVPAADHARARRQRFRVPQRIALRRVHHLAREGRRDHHRSGVRQGP